MYLCFKVQRTCLELTRYLLKIKFFRWSVRQQKAGMHPAFLAKLKSKAIRFMVFMSILRANAFVFLWLRLIFD